MKRYCIDCGSPTEYSIKKPLFCSNCGKSFDKSQKITQNIPPQKQTVAQKKYIVPKINDDLYEDDDIDCENIPNLSKLEIDEDFISESSSKKGVKLGSILGTSAPVDSKNKKNKSKKSSKKEILENFAKEAGSLRKNKKL